MAVRNLAARRGDQQGIGARLPLRLPCGLGIFEIACVVDECVTTEQNHRQKAQGDQRGSFHFGTISRALFRARMENLEHPEKVTARPGECRSGLLFPPERF